jgi:putative ABC transport system substrate-binding protein
VGRASVATRGLPHLTPTLSAPRGGEGDFGVMSGGRGVGMRRRNFMMILGGAAALAPLGATAQPGLPVIGYLSSRSAEAETPLRTGFLEGLEQRGFVVGRNVAIEYRYAEGSFERLPSLAAELIGLPAALLVATGASAALPAKKATATIPIVFSSGSDPVAAGLVDSLARPGGNATGTHGFGIDLIPKRLELLREILPQPGLIAFLVGPQTPATPVMLRQVEAAAQAVGQPPPGSARPQRR